MSVLHRTVLLGTLLVAGCVVPGSCDRVARNFTVEPSTDQISVCCGFQLDLTTGEPALNIKADDNILDAIAVRDDGERLVIEYARDDVHYFPSRKVQVRASLSEVSSVEATQGSSVEAARLQDDRLEVVASGGSRVRLSELAVTELEVHASGGSRVRSAGNAPVQTVKLSGGSSYDAFDLESRNADLDADGGSSAKMNVTENLNVRAGGGSRVRYQGTPDGTRDVSGGSSVRSTD